MSFTPRHAILLTLCAGALASCAEEEPAPTNSAEQATPAPQSEPASDAPDDASSDITTDAPEENDDLGADAPADEEENDDEPVARARDEGAPATTAQAEPVANPMDEELCVVPEGGLDLPTPERAEVTIVGREEDEALGRPNTLSNAGTYRLMLDFDEEAIAVGEPFGMVVTFEMTDGSRVPGGVFLDISGYMPRHFHGMNVEPIETPTTRGRYEVENIVFHMTGLWEVYFDLSHRGVTERAQFTFEVK